MLTMLGFFRQKGMSAIKTGALMFLFGLGLSLASILDAAPGAAFFVFPGLMLGGLIRIVFGLITIRSGDMSENGRSMPRPARSPINSYVALPEETPDGYCWQCGRMVKADAVICLRCGATQAKPAPKGLNLSSNLTPVYSPPDAIPVAVTPASYAAQYPPQGGPGFPGQGMPPQGWSPQGMPPQGWSPQGGPPQGYPGYPSNYPPGYPPNPIPTAQRGRRGQPPQQPQRPRPEPRRQTRERERKPSHPFKTLRDWTRR